MTLEERLIKLAAVIDRELNGPAGTAAGRGFLLAAWPVDGKDQVRVRYVSNTGPEDLAVFCLELAGTLRAKGEGA